jgi:DNA-binding LacI/PurR family transcriptional regulator
MSSAAQLADYLRGRILRGEVTEPLPGIRDWSVQLGVGRSTLEQTVGILKREGLLRVLPRRGIRIQRTRTRDSTTGSPRVVRWLSYRRRFSDRSDSMEFLGAVEERLQFHEIHLHHELCDAARLRANHKRGENPNQLLLLSSLPPEMERMFGDFRRSALVIGKPNTGVSLPYVSNDVWIAIRHAVVQLARRGLTRVCMVMTEATPASLDAEYHTLCAESGTGVRGETARLPMELEEQAQAARRFAAQIKGRLGVIALYPIAATMLTSALLERGIAVPGQVAVVAMNTTRQSVRVVPTPIYYPYPVAAFANAVVRAALQYFERGRLPRLRKQIPLAFVQPR